MTITSFEKEWKTIKTNFEKATEKKKPSEKFLGVFNKASGLTPATSAFDKAVVKADYKLISDALAALQKAGKEYQGVLGKAAAAEKDRNVQAEVKVMINEITALLEEGAKSAKVASKLKRCSKLSDFEQILKTKGNADRVIAYAKTTRNQELILFLAAMAKKDYSSKTFKTFVAEGSPQEINIDYVLREKFKEDSLRSAPWGDATTEVLKLFNSSIVDKLNSGA